MTPRPAQFLASACLLLASGCTAAKNAPTFNPGQPSCQVKFEEWGRRLSAKVQGEWAHVDKGLFTETRVQRLGNSIVLHSWGSREIATTDGRNMTYNYGWGFKRSMDVTRDEMEMKYGLVRHRYSSSGYCQPEDRALGTAALEQVLQQEEQDRQQKNK